MSACTGTFGAPADPPGRADPPSSWRAVGATVDRCDTLPGPFGRPLMRLGNALNPFARLDGPPLEIGPGGRAVFTVVVAAPSTLSSALVLAGEAGQAELRIDWTETPPGFALSDRRGGLAATAGAVERLGGDCWRLALEALNGTGRAVTLVPSLHVACGIANAGLAVGLYAGLLRTGLVGAGATGAR